MTSTPWDVVHAFYSALESGTHGEELRSLFTADVVTVEHPNRLKPTGATVHLEQMLAASAAGSDLLAWQRYDIRDMFDAGPVVIVRCTWTGQIAKEMGGFHAGQQLTAHLAQFIEVRAGKIASIETYDCYEPF